MHAVRIVGLVSTHALIAERDTQDIDPAALAGMFQPTRSRGARLSKRVCLTVCSMFQPTRSRGARRQAAETAVDARDVSTHAITRSATPVQH